MSYADHLSHTAKQLLLQKGLQAKIFIDQLVAEGLASTEEVEVLLEVALQESTKGWERALQLVRKKDPSRGLDVLQSLLREEDTISKDILSRLQQLWISGS